MSEFGNTLLRASIEGGLFAAAVWLLLRLAPRVPAALGCWLWWAVSLKLLLGLIGLPVLELPLLPRTAVPVATVALGSAPASAVTTDFGPAVALTGAAAWAPSMALVLWLAGLVIAAGLLARDAMRMRRVLAHAERVTAAPLGELFSELCGRFGLRSIELLASEQVRSPQVLGWRKVRVLVPRASLDRHSTAELQMVLAHELAHVVRGDLLLGWVPTLARRLFFFHPLAALAVREYALAREAACDAEAIRVLGSTPQSYGRLLLKWGAVPGETGFAAAAAPPSLQLLKRRLSMLDHIAPLTGRRRAAARLAAAALLLVGLVPLKLVAQSSPAAEATPPPAVDRVASGGNWSNPNAATELLDAPTQDFLNGLRGLWERPRFFVVDGTSYQVRDADLLGQIDRLYEPVERLKDQLAKLDAKPGQGDPREEALRRQIAAASEVAEQQMRPLMEKAIASGLAVVGGC